MILVRLREFLAAVSITTQLYLRRQFQSSKRVFAVVLLTEADLLSVVQVVTVEARSALDGVGGGSEVALVAAGSTRCARKWKTSELWVIFEQFCFNSPQALCRA